MAKTETRGLRFVGRRKPDGQPVEYVGWAPARDLTPEEVNRIGPDKAEQLVASNLYRWSGEAKPPAKRAARTRASKPKTTKPAAKADAPGTGESDPEKPAPDGDGGEG